GGTQFLTGPIAVAALRVGVHVSLRSARLGHRAGNSSGRRGAAKWFRKRLAGVWPVRSFLPSRMDHTYRIADRISWKADVKNNTYLIICLREWPHRPGASPASPIAARVAASTISDTRSHAVCWTHSCRYFRSRLTAAGRVNGGFTAA